MRLLRLVIVVLAVMALSCPGGGLFGTGCGEIRFRCNGNRMELCNADGDWELFRNCASVGDVCAVGPNSCSGFPGPCCT